MPKKIAILGSLNVDMTTRAARLPSPGETLTATSFTTLPGGKGANQAVACARLSRSVDVEMVGFVGCDAFANEVLQTMAGERIGIKGVKKVHGKTTGVAVILVEEESGENRILLAPNANESWPRNWSLVPEGADVVVFQLEVPTDAVILNIHDAKARGVKVILNPAPATHLPPETYSGLDHLIMNESEACILTDRKPSDLSALDCHTIAKRFILLGVQNVVITLGAEGLYYCTATSDKSYWIPAHNVPVRDTTGAGDTFVGAYAVAVAESLMSPEQSFDIEAALSYASLAAALSVQKEGAMASIPGIDEVAEFAVARGIPPFEQGS